MINNNLLLFLFTVSPALIYLAIILKYLPSKKISKQKIITGLTSGILSTTLVNFLYFIFPKYSSQISSNMIINVFFMAFIQIALVEEFFKYSAYKLNKLQEEEYFFPTETFILCLLPSVSFAIIENFQYVNKFKYQGWNVALQRSVSATVMHIICGSIIGFGVVLGKISKNKKIIYTICGITMASFVHGLYDLSLIAANKIPGYSKKIATENSVAIIMVSFLIMIFILKNIKSLSSKTFS